MNTRTLIIAALWAVVPALATAQSESTSDDLALWLSAGVEKKLSKKCSVEAEGEFRMRDNVSSVERFSLGLSVSYKLTKWLKADAGYDFLDNRKEGGLTESGKYYNSTCWYPRHRVHASLVESVKAGRFKVSLRERWVYTYAPSFGRHRMDMRTTSATYGMVLTKTRDGNGEHILRTRLAVEYDIPKSRFKPYASAEAYFPFGVGVCFGRAQKMRYTAGTECKLSKRHSAKVFYLFQDRTHINSDDDVRDSHVIGAGYTYDF